MKKVIIKNKAGSVIGENEVEDEQAFLEQLKISSPYGKPAHDEAVFDVDGKTIIDTIHHKAEYTVEVLDITAEVEAERTKKKAKHADRLSRIEQLKAINWAEIDTVKELKEIVKLLAKEAIKDDE